MNPSPVVPHTDIITTILQASLDCVVVANYEGQIVEFNPSAERAFGYSRADVIGKPMVDLIIPPHYRAAHLKGMDHYLETGEGPVLNKRIEITAYRSNGHVFPVELTVIPSLMGDQPVFVSFLRDITDRKASEAKLVRISARLSQLITNLDGGILVEDESRHIALVNQAFCDMFAIPAPPETLIGTDCSGSAEATKHLFADPQYFTARIATILQERETVIGETLHMADGRVLARDYVPVYNNDEYIGHLWHYHDATEAFRTQRRWERMLKFEEVNRETNRLFLQLDDVDDALNRALAMTGQLLDVSRVYVFRFRENERILDNTHEWCAPGVKPEIDNLKGLPFDELLPSFFPMIAQYDLIAPRHIRELPDDLRGILEPQDIQTILWVPIYLDNRIEGFLGYDETRSERAWLPEEITMARIITESYARSLERERAARMLVEARDEAVRTAQLRAQFVANMSHEIRTPMTGTLGMLELLLETELDELQTEFATEAFNSSSRLLTIINEILDFSKLEAGQIVLEANPIDLKAIVTEVRMTLMPQVKHKPVEIEVNVDAQVPYRVFGDATRIRQVLMNLAGNAVKFTHRGHVRLAINALRSSSDVAYLRFTVEDTGVGIAPEHLDHIFESFVQADGGITRKYGGSGLGLSISRQLVELMGGTISVESTPNEGSTFSFALRLPVAQANSVLPASAVEFDDLSVLIIDHNRTTRYVLTQQLENWGVNVTQIHEAAEFATAPVQQRLPFDIIFQRCDSCNHNAVLPELTPQAAQQIVYITDDIPAPQSGGSVCLRWPIDQSSLYNLLVQTTYLHVPQAADKTKPQPDHVTGRILLADDYRINTDLVKRALTDLDIHLDCVENGQQVLDRLEQAPYDVVLMDMHMPVMDGIEATQRIRQSGAAYATLPIIALTASVMREEQDNYLAIGVTDIIGKPFSVKHLREVVQHWLEAAQQADHP
jgi:hypothetical protein